MNTFFTPIQKCDCLQWQSSKKHDKIPYKWIFNCFFYSLKALEFKRQYPKKLEDVLNFIKTEGTKLQEKLYGLYHKVKSNTKGL